jgi:hypothetical protein
MVISGSVGVGGVCAKAAQRAQRCCAHRGAPEKLVHDGSVEKEFAHGASRRGNQRPAGSTERRGPRASNSAARRATASPWKNASNAAGGADGSTTMARRRQTRRPGSTGRTGGSRSCLRARQKAGYPVGGHGQAHHVHGLRGRGQHAAPAHVRRGAPGRASAPRPAQSASIRPRTRDTAMRSPTSRPPLRSRGSTGRRDRPARRKRPSTVTGSRV